jgi:hypothetical protein
MTMQRFFACCTWGGFVGYAGQPTIGLGATGDAVEQLERALRRTPDLGLTVDGVFGPAVEVRGQRDPRNASRPELRRRIRSEYCRHPK